MEQNNNVETSPFSIGPRQSTLFGGEIQQGEPYNQSEDIPGRDRTNKREYDRARQAKARKKAKDKRLIEAFVEQTGFSSFYQSHRVQIDINSHIWDSPAYGREYYKTAAQVLFTGYVPNFWEFLLLLVVRISNTTGSAPLPFVNYLTSTYTRGLEEVRDHLGKMGVLESREDAR